MSAPALERLARRLAARVDAGEFLSPAWTCAGVVEAVEHDDGARVWALVREPRHGAPALVLDAVTLAEAVDGLVTHGVGHAVYLMTIGAGVRSCEPDEWEMEDALAHGQEPSMYWTECETDAGALVATVTLL